jgi:hypothetical protein
MISLLQDTKDKQKPSSCNPEHFSGMASGKTQIDTNETATTTNAASQTIRKLMEWLIPFDIPYQP